MIQGVSTILQDRPHAQWELVSTKGLHDFLSVVMVFEVGFFFKLVWVVFFLF